MLQPENVEQLRSVLLRHVLPNIRLAADIPFGTNEVQAANGELVKITKSREGVTIESSAGNARVIATDVLASNGVVHIVDTVFWYMRIAVFMTCQIFQRAYCINL